MKTIGLLGGMSWESTTLYYQTINKTVNERLGGLHSARIILYSVDFHDVEALQRAGQWEEAGRLLANAAKRLEAASADCLVICTNTMHCVATYIVSEVGIPLLHIADATAQAVKQAGVTTVGLLGTRFTMEQDFYRGRLEREHGLAVLTPRESDREIIHTVIYDELCQGKALDASREQYRRIINELARQGAQGVILGCTEISLLMKPEDSSVALFDTTTIHARSAALWALADLNGNA